MERAQPQAGAPAVRRALGCPHWQHWEVWLHLGPHPKRHIPVYLRGNAFTLSKGPQKLPYTWGVSVAPGFLPSLESLLQSQTHPGVLIM